MTLCIVGGVSFLLLAVSGCSDSERGIPKRFRGTFHFDKEASVAYWEAQKDWPQATKEKLVRMALPTTLELQTKHVIVLDQTTGQKVVRDAEVGETGKNHLSLNLFSNFARAEVSVAFEFDENGFWMLEGTLFPDYRERFERAKVEVAR